MKFILRFSSYLKSSIAQYLFLTLFSFLFLIPPEIAHAIYDLAITQHSDLPDTVARSGPVTYTIQLENIGGDNTPTDQGNVILDFTYPVDNQFDASSSSTECSLNGAGTIRCQYDPGIFTAGMDPVTATIVIFADVPGTETDTFNVMATITQPLPDGNGNTDNNDEGQNTTVINGADLLVDLTDNPDPARGGSDVTYTATISTNGPNDAVNPEILFTLDQSTTYVAGSATNSNWSCSYDDNATDDNGNPAKELTCTRSSTLASGAADEDITFKAAVDGASSGTITAVAFITSDTTDPFPNNNTESEDTTLAEGLDLTIDIGATPLTVTEGDDVAITIRPGNNGPSDGELISFAFTIPEGYVVKSGPTPTVSGEWSCVSDNDPDTPTYTCTATATPALDALEEDTIELTLTAPAWPGAVNPATITATIATTSTDIPEPAERLSNNSDSVIINLQRRQADLRLVKVKGPNPVAQYKSGGPSDGSVITTTIRVDNLGPEDADGASSDIKVVDTILNVDNEEFISVSGGANWDCSHAAGVAPTYVITCYYRAVIADQGQSDNLTILTRPVAPGLGEGGTLSVTNNAEVTYSGTPGDFNPGNDTASAAVLITEHIVDLTLNKSVSPGTLASGQDTLTYTFEVCNGADADPATHIRVTDTVQGYYSYSGSLKQGLPPYTTGITFPAGSDFSCTNTDANVTCNYDSANLDANQCVDFDMEVSRPLQHGDLTNTASVTSVDQGEYNLGNNQGQATATVNEVADIEVTKTVTPDNIKSGTEALWVVTIRNRGPSTAENVVLTDTFSFEPLVTDAGFTVLSIDSPVSCSGLTVASYSTDSLPPDLVCNLGDFTAGHTETVKITVRPNHQPGLAHGTIRKLINQASVTTDTTENVSSNNSISDVELLIEQDKIDLVINDNDSFTVGSGLPQEIIDGVGPDPFGHNPEVGSENENVIIYRVDYYNIGPSYATGVNFDFSMTPQDTKTVKFLCDSDTIGGANTCSTDVLTPDTSGNICTIDSGTNPVTGPSTLKLNCAESGSAADLPVGQVNGKDRFIAFYVQSIPASTGDTHNTSATIRGNEFESNLGNNTELESTNVNGLVDLEITSKIASVDGLTVTEVNRTQAFDWTIVVTNNGPSESRQTLMEDKLSDYNFILYDENISCSNDSSSPDVACSCTVSSGDVSCDLGTMTKNATATIKIPVRYDGGAGSRNNCATVSTFDVESDTDNDTECNSITVTNKYHASDFGDAPDPNSGTARNNYQTRLQYGGARHYLPTDTPYLGSCVDADYPFRTPNSTATTDDATGNYSGSDLASAIGSCSGNDDEDGVTIPLLKRDNNNTISVVVRGGNGCYLSGWIDLNQDGVWDDSPGSAEKIADDLDLTFSGPQTERTEDIVYAVPSDATVGYTFARFRCSSDTGLQPTSVDSATHPAYAINGEVEDYRVAIQPDELVNEVDYGDAEGYQTLLVDDGASHIYIPGKPHLGPNIDTEDGTQQNSEATADDLDDKTNDEDGITFPDSITTGQSIDIQIETTNGNCFINGWIDYNQNTSWNDSGEQIITNKEMGGITYEDVTIPDTARLGETFARFRCTELSSDLGVKGAAPNGEVEDYLIEILGYIEGQVRLDTDADGILVDSEDGIPGVTIQLFRDDDSLVDTTTTDSNGDYGFYDLEAGHYYVIETDPFDHQSTNDVDGDTSYDFNRVDVDLNTSSSTGNDFLDTHLSSLGDRVWFDTNRNGLQDSGEVGIAGVTVKLYDDGGIELNQTITDGKGFYIFTELKTDSYRVEFIPPADYSITSKDQGSIESIDSDCYPSGVNQGKTDLFILPHGQYLDTIDAGMYLTNGDLPARLGDTVWLDSVTSNSIQDANEPGVSGVVVNLQDGNGVQLATITTDGTGQYTFTGLAPGNYRVEFVRPSGYANFVTQNSGSDATRDSDVDSATGITEVIPLVASQNNPDIDAGLPAGGTLPASLGNLVWYDTDKNGVQDSGEPGVGNVTVTLLDGSRTYITSTVTAGDGSYSFVGLNPGTYIVNFRLPTGYSFTNALQGGNATLDSDVVTTSDTDGDTGEITLSPGENNVTIDGGIFLTSATPITIGDLIWLDVNYNFLPDPGEGLDNVGVILQDLQGNVLQTTTTVGGAYSFTNLANPGDYTVVVDTATLPAGVYQIDDPDTTNDSQHTEVSLATDNLDFDFGYQYENSIGDYVWLDQNEDGIQDPSETGLANIEVNLYDDSDNPLGSTQTDGNGFYLFNRLPAGNYTIEFVLPTGFSFSSADQTDDDLDSDADTGDGTVAGITLGDNEKLRTIDAGMHYTVAERSASLGDLVWYDSNEDGIQDSGEPGVPGITVNLLDGVGGQLQTTTTDAQGAYGFTGLDAGDYIVEFIAPGYTISDHNQGGDAQKDSDADSGTGKSDTITLAATEYNPHIDAGIFLSGQLPASIGDLVWYDTNENGIQDAGEPGAGGITVTLFTAAGSQVTNTVTAGDGSYSFTGLSAGTYYVHFDLPGGYVFSPNGAGTISTDSDPDSVSGNTPLIPLIAGEHNSTIDGGIYLDSETPITIGDLIWLDKDYDNSPGAGEGIPGVSVILEDAFGSVIRTTTTASDGSYSFTHLAHGDYRVVVDTETLPAGIYQITDPDTTLDSSHAKASLSSDNLEFDFGYGYLNTIGDYVWHDLDRDGIQDPEESGIAGITVTLLDGIGTELDTMETDGSGYYLFTRLKAGDYQIQFDLPAGYQFSPADQVDDALDSDPETTTGRVSSISLGDGVTNRTIDAGMYLTTGNRAAELGDRVWYDTNENGIQDDGEPGVAGVTVNLLNESDVLLSSTTTDGNGNYLFTGLAGGNYRVEFIAPGYSFSAQGQGSDVTKDSDASPATGRTDIITLADTERNPHVDAGVVISGLPPASVGDFVWYDTNKNGIQESGEPGVGGVQVDLHADSGATVATTTTAGDGSYSFTGLGAGSYYVYFALPANHSFTLAGAATIDTDSNPDQITGNTALFPLVAGEHKTSIDAGMYLTSATPLQIGDLVWLDRNYDGEPDPGEGIAGVTVRVEDSFGTVLRTTVTDTNGNYLFTELDNPGDYRVIVDRTTLPEGVYQIDDPDTLFDSMHIQSGLTTDNLEFDFGYSYNNVLGDYVWLDQNQNGIQDSGEVGISSITVHLIDTDDGNYLDSTVTDGNGYYQFSKLGAGNYILEFILPEGYAFSPERTTDAHLDSNVIPDTGLAKGITLGDNEQNRTIDAGMYFTAGGRSAMLGDRVWHDSDRNGIQDAGEAGVSGITVNLLQENGTTIASTTTDGDGNYSFTGLAAGNYRIEFETGGYTITTRGAGTNEGDSDGNPSDGRTSIITLAEGEINPHVDCGVYLDGTSPASLGDFVWNDVNKNGIQDSGESGVGGVLVALYMTSAPDTVVSTTYTDITGNYGFTTLLPGSYLVEFTLPSGYSFSDSGAGTVSTDSDASQLTGRSETISLSAGEHDPTIDAGIWLEDSSPGSIGDLVWIDHNRNDTPDSGEGVGGVTLRLYSGANILLAETTTDTNGGYLFDSLPPGNYRVVVDRSTLPDGIFQIADPDYDLDSEHTVIGLKPGLFVDTVDFGYSYSNSVGDYVWFDENRDGVQNPDEMGVAGVTVNLLDRNGTLLRSQKTDGTGGYTFSLLPTEQYMIEFVPPTGFLFTSTNQGSGALQDSFDSDGDEVTGRTPLFSLGEKENLRTLDCGLYLENNGSPASIGNYVWFDTNKNGIQDPSERGVSGITVKLWDATYSEEQARSVTTDGSGFYLFSGLLPGQYGVEFQRLKGYVFTGAGEGGDETVDSDPSVSDGRVDPVTLDAGESNVDVDAGIYLTEDELPAQLGNRVWYDQNHNGVQDEGEPGVSGVRVHHVRGPISSTTTTDVNGEYLFTGVRPGGKHQVAFILPDGFHFSPQGSGTPKSDSDADPFTGQTSMVTLEPGEYNPDLDAGIYGSGGLLTIGDLVWLDLNHNHQPDAGEGIADVELVLYSAKGLELLRTVTDTNGNYSFTGIPEGDYRVAVDTATLPLDTTPDPDAPLIQLADPDDDFDDAHHLAGFVESTDRVDFGYRLREVDVELDKTFSHTDDVDRNTKINTNDVLTFTITVENRGPDSATGVTVTDQLPEGYILGEVITSQGSYSEPVWDVGQLGADESATLTMQGTVTNLKYYLNTAEVTGTNEYDIDSTPDNDISEEDDQDSVLPDVQNFPWGAFMAAIPPCPPHPSYCYLVSDNDSTGRNNSALIKYTFGDGKTEFIGRLGVGGVEAMTLSLDGTTLFGVNSGVFGIIDISKGNLQSFQKIGRKIGFGRGSQGTVRLYDIDGMAFDPTSGVLYATVRRSDDLNGLDMLIKLNPQTGTVVRDGFGAGIDYIEIKSRSFGLFHTDDIAIDAQGIMYGIVGNSGGGGGDLLVTIDKENGMIEPVGNLMANGQMIQDMEGLTFYFRNTLFGSTGVEFSKNGSSNSLFKIQTKRADSEHVSRLDKEINGFIPFDFEAISCPVCR